MDRQKNIRRMRSSEELRNGFEHAFRPLEQIDIEKISTFSGLTQQMSRTAFGGRSVGQAVDVLTAMFGDPNCTVIATLSGAMTIAKQGGVIADLLSHGCIDAIVSTGAIICHGVAEELGNTHFEYDPHWDEESLYAAGYDRVYDTLELEQSMDQVENLVFDILSKRDSGTAISSFELCALVGAELAQRGGSRGSIREAYERQVPIFIPAFTDSELGLDLAIYNARKGHDCPLACNPLLDFEAYVKLVAEAKHIGILTIGGGVPRNWAQQVGPYVDGLQRRGIWDPGNSVRFQYCVRICPEPVHWGGLSGCTCSEGVSWGKFASAQEEGRFAEVLCDATVVFPLLV